MKYKKNVLGITLAAALLMTSLAGCGSAEDTSVGGDTADSSTVVGDASSEIVDRALQYSGLPKDTVVMTVDGVDVTAEAYIFWIIDFANAYYYYYDDFWNEPMGDATMVEYALEQADYSSILYAVIEAKAAENGIELTDEQIADIELQEEEIIATLEEQGSYTFQDVIDLQGVSEEGFRRINSIYYYYTALTEQETAAGGAAEYTEQAVIDYAEYYGMYSVKHILFSAYTTDEEGTSVERTDEEMAEQLALAEECYDMLMASDNLYDDFVAYMTEYSEDARYYGTDELAYPDGYVAYSGEMVTEFEEASYALEVGELSEPILSEYGYHLILREEDDMTAIAETDVTGWLMEEVLVEWVENADVVKTDSYYLLDPVTIFDNVSLVLVEINERMETEAAVAAEETEVTAEEEIATTE